MATSNEEIEEELAAIDAILNDGLKVEHRKEDGRPVSVTYQCSPLVASEADRSYVGLTLIIQITDHYPAEIPKVKIRNPRGLDENDVNDLIESLVDRCHQYVGGPVIFELIDRCQEFLTERNVPACPCAICLRHIVGEDDFVKTICFHYFHTLCFGRYVKNVSDNSKEDDASNKKFNCPVCRGQLPEVASSETARFLAAKPPSLESEERDFKLTKELKDLQDKMQRLFSKQKEAGGIIDIEADSKKFLIVTSQSAGGEEGQASARCEPHPEALPFAGIQKPTQAAEQPKKHKGGSGMHKKRDYGEKKRSTRRRN